MKHKGKARQAAIKLINGFIGLWVLINVAVVVVELVVERGEFNGSYFFYLNSNKSPCGVAVCILFLLFVAFTLYFFRDPEAKVPAEPKLVLSPGHGKVDAIGTAEETVFMGGKCQRISMFLSVIDIHVQNTPVAGTVKYVKHTPGKFLSATGADSAVHNENVLVGFESNEGGAKIGVRLIAGLIARRIIPWVQVGETVARGERMSLIQFGSRVDVYLPLTATIKVKLGDRVVGGESVLATLA